MNATKKTQTTAQTTERTDEERARDRLERAEYTAGSRQANFDQAIDSLFAAFDRWKEDINRMRAYPDQSATKLAERVQHEVIWGLANLGLDNLTSLAAEADTAKKDADDARKAMEAAATATTKPEAN